MPKDRLDNNSDRIQNLDDLIDARKERTSAIADDVDGLEDVEATEVDVEDALTFPHPRREREGETPEPKMIDRPAEEDVSFDFQDSAEEMLPTEYAQDFDELQSTHFSDEDAAAEEDMHDLGELGADDLIYNTAELDVPEQGGIRSDESAEDQGEL